MNRELEELQLLINYEGFQDVIIEVLNDGIGLELLAIYAGAKILGTEKMQETAQRALDDYVENVRKLVV